MAMSNRIDILSSNMEESLPREPAGDLSATTSARQLFSIARTPGPPHRTTIVHSANLRTLIEVKNE